MKNRPRPNIPVATKLAVAGRQIQNIGGLDILMEYAMKKEGETMTHLLERRLVGLASLLGCPRQDLRLDHDPALRWRRYDPRVKNVAARFQPNANSPEHLIYRTKEDHHIKTQIRGEHGQHADMVLIRRERKRENPKPKRKHKLASRPLRSANRWVSKSFEGKPR